MATRPAAAPFRRLQCRACDHFILQGPGEGVLVNHWAARAVHEIGGRFHQFQRFVIDEVKGWLIGFALPQEWIINVNVIGLSESGFELNVLNPGLFPLDSFCMTQVH